MAQIQNVIREAGKKFCHTWNKNGTTLIDGTEIMDKDFIIKIFNDLKPIYKSLPRKILYNRNIGSSIDIDRVQQWNNNTRIRTDSFFPMKRIYSDFDMNVESSATSKLMTCLQDIKNQEEKLFLESLDDIACIIETDNLLNGMAEAISIFDKKFKSTNIIGKDVSCLGNVLRGYTLDDNINIPEHTYYMISNSQHATEFVISQDLEISFTDDNLCILKEWICPEIHPFKTVVKIITSK